MFDGEVLVGFILHVDWTKLPNQDFYSWDYQSESTVEANYLFYRDLENGAGVAYFIINRNGTYTAQLDILNQDLSSWYGLFGAIHQISINNIRINNVDLRQKTKYDTY